MGVALFSDRTDKFAFAGDTFIDFYGVRGLKLADKRWALGSTKHRRLMETPPFSYSQNVHRALSVRGSGTVEMLILGARHAVVYFLEGGLTPAELIRIQESEEYLEIPDVVIGDQVYTVRIVPEVDFGIAAADADGKILAREEAPRTSE